MPVDRPTFSESWYRVSGVRPRLRSTVHVHRQHFRGEMWHVLQDPASNQFFRLSDAAYQFVALLDGRRTVADAWAVCNEHLGDSAPTQGEAIQLLGQLHTSNLLHAELSPDTESLFRRYRKRVTREVQGYLMNLLFIRIPLLDPDVFLDRWVGMLGRAFSRTGLVVWAALMCVGLYSLAGRGADLVNRASGILNPDNLPLLYLGLVLVKVLHEFSHAFACKKFGRAAGTGGEVHVMGIMFLVFTPLPYIDASSAWAFRRKWHRVLVGTSGMMAELAVAAGAAVVWSRTAPGHPLNALAYNMMFIAGVSTILFNGNPLLRYDGYYILSDLLEIPNLAQRSKGYVYYLIRRYAWGVRRARTTAHTKGERGWLAFYAVASTLYRVFICVAILMFIAKRLFFVGVILAVLAVFTWVLVPLGKFIHYLGTSGELERTRPRAVWSTLAVAVAIIVCFGLVQAPDRYRFEGVVEPVGLAFVHAGADGFVEKIVTPSGEHVEQGDVLLVATSPDLETRAAQLRLELRRLEVKKHLVQSEDDPAGVQIVSEEIAAIREQLQHAEDDLAALTLRATQAGQWIAPDVEYLRGAYLHRGQKVGRIASVDDLIIRAVSGQDSAGPFHDQITAKRNDRVRRVELRVKGRPDLAFTGRIDSILDAGTEQLPSEALGYAAGGSVETELEDTKGLKAAERFFEIRIRPDTSRGLLSGQLVVIRAELTAKPLAVQWYQSVLRLLQRRFRI